MTPVTERRQPLSEGVHRQRRPTLDRLAEQRHVGRAVRADGFATIRENRPGERLGPTLVDEELLDGGLVP